MTCEEQWARYRKLRWQAFFGWLFASYMGRFSLDLSRFIHLISGFYLPDRVFYVLVPISILIGFSGLFVTWFRWGWWACPRCAKPFFGVSTFGLVLGANPFRRNCGNCDLRKWTCPEEEQESQIDGGIVIRPRHETPLPLSE